MNDVPPAEACASDASPAEEMPVSPTVDDGDMTSNRLARILPRLSAISAQVAVIAPALLLTTGIDGLGSGARGC
jgi:hypothetical protein